MENRQADPTNRPGTSGTLPPPQQVTNEPTVHAACAWAVRGKQNDPAEIIPDDVPERDGPAIIQKLALLPPGSFITERGLAEIFGKCTASIKAAVERGELPRPVKLMGKPTWTAGSIIAYHEARLESEGRKFARMRP
jgi:predicted DNA-binding transcriptional regulator AlpA